MSDLVFLAALYCVALVLNLVWEFWHAHLYTTCLQMERTALTKLLVWQSVKDAFWIILVYWAVPAIIPFALLLFVFSFVIEFHAVRTKRWEYAPSMPTFLGVGISPLFELVVTGLLAVALVSVVL